MYSVGAALIRLQRPMFHFGWAMTVTVTVNATYLIK
jgi:hypothetical protein